MSFLTDTDRQRISDAIRDVEKRTTGEIVTVVARESDPYRFIPTLWAALVALIVPGLFGLSGAAVSLAEVAVTQLFVFLILTSLGRWPPIKYRLVPKRVKRSRAARRAREQFYLQGVRETQERTGILIYVSVAERYVEILADSGISQIVGDETWQAAVDELVNHVRAGRIAEGFCAAIDTCGRVLMEHFPATRENPAELPNHLIEL